MRASSASTSSVTRPACSARVDVPTKNGPGCQRSAKPDEIPYARPSSARTRLISRDRKPPPPSSVFIRFAGMRAGSRRESPSCANSSCAWPRSGRSTTTTRRAPGVDVGGGAPRSSPSAAGAHAPNCSRTRAIASSKERSPTTYAIDWAGVKSRACQARRSAASSVSTLSGAPASATP
ncbi:MAG: hypothetical protein DCC71_13450 [Proteobacteria bacterium]|nr:MAG: hypothetical protein DCC71_13450 [Pseudomonadota bacterium]